MENFKCTTHEEVMFFDTDCGGVVHNIAYLRMIETCRTRLATQIGMDLPKMMTTKIFPVVVRTEIDYHSPAKLGDRLIVQGHLEKLERARFWCSFVMHREQQEKPLISCKQTLAIVKMPEGRPQRIPKEWHEQWNRIDPV
jgi:YbgC/YbaW family acyl-CoA thioester hydrolase